MGVAPGLGLKLNRPNTSWLQQNNSSSPLLGSQMTGGGGGGMAGILSGLAGNINPILAGVSGGANILGAILGAKDENKRFDREMGFREKEADRDQKNFDRKAGQNAISMMKDDYITALTRMLRRY